MQYKKINLQNKYCKFIEKNKLNFNNYNKNKIYTDFYKNKCKKIYLKKNKLKYF